MFNKNEFKAMIVRKGLTFKQVADLLHINEGTLRRRLSNDGNLTVKQLETLFSVFGKDEIISVFFC